MNNSAGTWTWTIRDLGPHILREYTSTGTTGASNWTWREDYVWRGDGLLATETRNATSGATVRLHFHLDHLGTPRLVTNASGQKIAAHDYYAFGAELANSPIENPEEAIKFSGHERDPLTGDVNGLTYMHARFYSGGMGRFLSVDPLLDVKAAMAKPQAWNRYGYVRNNPLRFTDPTGKYVCSESKAGNCDVVDEAITRMHVAENNMSKNDPRRAQLHAVLTALGAKGDSKSTISHIYANAIDQNRQRVIPKGDPVHGYILGAPGKEKGSLYLSLENALASPRAGGNPDRAITLLGGTITHETEHRLQPISGDSARPSFLSHVFYEHEAYELENSFFRGYGQPSLQQDATAGAFASATAACQQAGGCQP